MWTFLSARNFLKIPNGALLAGAFLALVIFLVLSEKADDKNNQQIGASAERTKTLEKTVEQGVSANEAREEIRRPDIVGDRIRYEQCLRSSRENAANCRRFLPVQ